MKIEMKKTWAP